MNTSSDTRHWINYFRANQSEPEEIPWDMAVAPPEPVAAILIPSLQQFQLGENGTGLHFLELAREHGRISGDTDFPEAVALFIAEEQRHSRLLAQYLHGLGAPLLNRHWMHAAFRWLRHSAGLEGKVAVLVTAEVMAIPYYRAVMRISPCPALQAICRRILREEAQHLLFQGSTLRRIELNHAAWRITLVRALQRLLLAGTCLITWGAHRRVFAAAGGGLSDVWRTALRAFGIIGLAGKQQMCNYSN